MDRPPAKPVRRIAAQILRSVERFLKIEASSGVVLLATSGVALAWANSDRSESYEHLWHTPLIQGDLHFWINDGLMTLFFLVVGIQIRHELRDGAMSDARSAALPVVAAVGGMVIPALLYMLVNRTDAVRIGWGIPIATDIAFAVGILTLLGKHASPGVRMLLLALAIIDDIGAILLIAIFYSSAISFYGVFIAGIGMSGAFAMRRLGMHRVWPYFFPGVVIWIGMLKMGIHPTVAGVLLGLLMPRDPAEQVQRSLHPWVAFAIMPLFALANAGVNLQGIDVRAGDSSSVAWGIVLGLVVGKPLGIVLSSVISVRLGLALPDGVSWSGIVLLGCIAGVGFTMAIFVAGLAFTDPTLLGAAKVGVLAASIIAAIVALLFGRFASNRCNATHLSSPEQNGCHENTTVSR